MSASAVLLPLENPTALTVVPCALQLVIPEQSQRVPTHFIIIIDVSDSMIDSNKLENVKHSASLVLHFLSASDKMSIITFGDNSTIHCNSIVCSSENKGLIQSVIAGIQADGCTNLSAGLLSINSILNVNESDSRKTGVILLTDGLANTGVRSSPGLLALLDTIHVKHPHLSFQFVGYGMDHNSELLKAMAENTRGSYSIVESKEGAATVIGDSLGSLFSCVGQLVTIQCPPNSTVHGPYTIRRDNTIVIGDIYQGSDTVVLIDIPKGTSVPIVMEVTGTALPTLNTFKIGCPLKDWDPNAVDESFQISVGLTKLRYKCSNLFKEIQTITVHSPPDSKRAIKTAIQSFKEAIHRTAYDGNLVAMTLREECKSLEEAFNMISNTYINTGDIFSRLRQHETFIGLGRGTTMPITSQSPNAMVDEDSNPMSYLRSPTGNRLQRHVTDLMASMSIVPNDPAAIEEATQLSQAI